MGVAGSPVTKSTDAGSRAVQPVSGYWIGVALACLLLAVLATYSNHFQNGFHFDNSHSVVTNPYIRSLTNIPPPFPHARTPTPLPSHRNYPPLVSPPLPLHLH